MIILTSPLNLILESSRILTGQPRHVEIDLNIHESGWAAYYANEMIYRILSSMTGDVQ